MRKFPLTAVLLLLPAFALVFLVGCPATPKKDTKVDGVKADDKAKPPVVEGKGKLEVLTAALDGKVTGTVKIKGDPPKMPLEARIANHKDAPTCMMGKDFEKKEQLWIVDDKGGVANVVISLAAPTGKKFDKIKDEEPFKKGRSKLDQPHCAYVPHVVAVVADIEPLLIYNSSSLSHNVKIPPVADNALYDKILEPKTGPFPRTFSKAKDPITTECSVHPWMNAKILVFDHPYFAVTKEDGSFEIANVPTDTELTVYIWHEAKGKESAKKMTFKKGDNSLDLEIAK